MDRSETPASGDSQPSSGGDDSATGPEAGHLSGRLVALVIIAMVVAGAALGWLILPF